MCIRDSATNVASLATTTPIFLRPIKVINIPIPPPTAIFSGKGIALAIFSLIPPIERIRKKNPEINTIPNAVCQGTPFPNTSAVSYTHLDVYKRQIINL